ncbi:hypothetical protein AX774_g6623, partial [Zancudomyces culisetae]
SLSPTCALSSSRSAGCSPTLIATNNSIVAPTITPASSRCKSGSANASAPATRCIPSSCPTTVATDIAIRPTSRVVIPPLFWYIPTTICTSSLLTGPNNSLQLSHRLLNALDAQNDSFCSRKHIPTARTAFIITSLSPVLDIHSEYVPIKFTTPIFTYIALSLFSIILKNLHSPFNPIPNIRANA